MQWVGFGLPRRGKNGEAGSFQCQRLVHKESKAHAGASGYLGPRVHVGVGGVVVDLLVCMERMMQISSAIDQFGKLVGDELAGLSVALEFVLGAEAFECVLLAMSWAMG